MNMNYKKNWWRPEDEGGFFGRHYILGDNSLDGPYVHNPRSLEKRTSTEVDQIVRLLGLDSSKHILDCPCGYGRHSLELLRRGIKVTGIDVNPYFISLIKEQVNQQGLNGEAAFVVGDMRRMPVDDGVADRAMNIFTSFGFFEDQADDEKVLREFCRTLKPGGRLMIHFDYNYYRIINSAWEELEHRALRDGSTLFVDDNYDSSTKRIYGRWEIVPCGGGPNYEREYTLRVYSPTELTAMLTDCGFVNVTFRGDLEEPEKDLDAEAHETVVLAQKPAID